MLNITERIRKYSTAQLVFVNLQTIDSMIQAHYC